MSDTLIYTKAPADVIARLVEKMGYSVLGENEGHVQMACVALALSIEIPNLTPEGLQAGVKGATEWIAMFGANYNQPMKVN
jgi:hypothetical protein